MKSIIRLACLFLSLILVLGLAACGDSGKSTGDEPDLTIVAGSESKVIEPIIQRFAKDNDLVINVSYKGSVDMMLDLRNPEFQYDSVMPANSMWIRMGDKQLHRVKEEASIMRSPVVLGVKKSKVEELGWIDKDVTVADILDAVKSGKLRFAMTSATQSNSGASAYMGLLNALAGNPDVLTAEQLSQPDLRDKIKTLFSGLDRGSGSSGWLKDMFLQKYDYLDAMFNYESMLIAANQELTRSGREPLYAIYPVDGQAIADSTLGFVSKPENQDRMATFKKLRDYLLQPKIQQEIFNLGFRAGLIGMNPDNVNKSVYNPDWGIDLGRTISPITWPQADVIEQALGLYQTAFRKPSFTVYLLDISGSMEGEGLSQLKMAMAGLLDQKIAGRYLLQASEEDITVIIPFNNAPRSNLSIAVRGNKPEELQQALARVNSLAAGGGTNIYSPVAVALQLFAKDASLVEDHLPSIILMTDGKSNKGSMADIRNAWTSLKPTFDFPPIFGVTFGKADDAQLKEMTHMAVGRVFDGRKDGLEKAFRQAKGYN